MEKIAVVTGIWAMCAFCAVLFVRGASATAARRASFARIATRRRMVEGPR